MYTSTYGGQSLGRNSIYLKSDFTDRKWSPEAIWRTDWSKRRKRGCRTGCVSRLHVLPVPASASEGRESCAGFGAGITVLARITRIIRQSLSISGRSQRGPVVTSLKEYTSWRLLKISLLLRFSWVMRRVIIHNGAHYISHISYSGIICCSYRKPMIIFWFTELRPFHFYIAHQHLL